MVDEEAGQGGMEKGEGGLKKDESGVEQGEVRGHKEEGGEEDKGDNKGEEMCGGDLRCEGPLVADLVTGAMHAGRMARCDDQPGSASYPEAGVDAGGGGSSTVYSLFAYPAYDNFAGGCFGCQGLLLVVGVLCVRILAFLDLVGKWQGKWWGHLSSRPGTV